jgi:poly-beta-1,6-N-acetyl-D-glucosamine synthase
MLAVFWGSALLISYILVGYPVLLGALARRRKGFPATQESRFTVSVVIPVHNGAKFLGRKLDSILTLDYPRELLDILVVADGCTDETVSIAREYADRGVGLLVLPRGGKSAALNAAIPQLSGEILLLTDVRQTLEPESLRRLVARFEDPEIGVVSGELLLRRGTSHDEADVGLYWRYESWIRRSLGAVDSMFGATGPFYAIRSGLFTPIPPDILLDDVYLPMTIFFKGYRLVVEETARAFDYPMTRRREFDRKVRTLGGNYQLLVRMPQLLSLKNRQLFHFVSCKVLRLLLPWLLAALFISSWWLPAPWKWLMIWAQLVAYGLAAWDESVPQTSALKRLSSPFGTFVSFMIATILGLKVLFVPARTLWKVTDIELKS